MDEIKKVLAALGEHTLNALELDGIFLVAYKHGEAGGVVLAIPTCDKEAFTRAIRDMSDVLPLAARHANEDCGN